MPGTRLIRRRHDSSRHLIWRLLLFSSLALYCGADAAAGPPAFPLHTAGPYIADSNGVRVNLNAFNWYGAEGTDYVVMGLQAQPLNSIVSEIKSLGFNAVRLPWSNQMVESNPVVGNYALTANPGMEGENALTILDQVIASLTNAGIMVILDNHNSNAEWCCSTTDGNSLWYNSTYSQANWIADWQAMVQRYQSNPWVIGADLRNEPRSPATWGGSSSTDWHAAAELGGNAVLSIDPNLLIFVEGVNYAGDLSGVANLPVQLNVANHLVYEAHDYGYWYGSLSGYSSWLNAITPKWGYLVTGSNPQPLWIGEFGTCDSADTCVSSSNSSDNGYWFSMITSYIQDYGVNWSYWAINGTTESGHGGGFGTVEGYGVLNTSWNGSALASLTARLQSMMTPGSANFNLIPGGSPVSIYPGASANPTVTIIPENGFTGTVNLSCAVSAPAGAMDAPTCSVPATESISGTDAVSATVSIATTAAEASNASEKERRDIPHKAGDAILACVVLFIGSFARQRKSLLVLLVVMGAVLLPLGCGGGGGSSVPGTTAGAYTITVTGSAPGLNPATAQISVTVL